MRLAALVAAFLLLASPAPAREMRGAPPGDFDLYLLALTWSPGFCASGGDRAAPGQCASDAGFVVHGLWPQYERGYPSFCGPDRAPLRSDLAAAEGLMPSEGLARYEWRKHGSCSGLPPARYFSAVAAARDRVALPAALPRRTSPLDIERSFVLANPGLRTDMMAIGCGRSEDGTVLREVRICLTRDLRQFRRCPDEVEQQACHARSVLVPQVHDQ